jgi:NAD(P)-dependent dehydrogenase (short-subunit alcohol dehydrogenase family)
MSKLNGKVIIVTGASRGLGEAMAVGYGEAGATLVLAARTLADLERVAEDCKRAGAAAVTPIVTDVCQAAAVKHLVAETMGLHGRIDAFVANAGIGPAGASDKVYDELTSYDLEAVQAILTTNLVGAWLCMKYALPVMQDGSAFITIGSSTGRMVFPGTGIYGVSKAAVDKLTMIAAQEVGPKGITVNCLSPGGAIETAFFGPDGMPESLKKFTDGAPASIMVPAAVWLASDDARDINGAWVRARQFNKLGAEGMRAAIAEAASVR